MMSYVRIVLFFIVFALTMNVSAFTPETDTVAIKKDTLLNITNKSHNLSLHYNDTSCINSYPIIEKDVKEGSIFTHEYFTIGMHRYSKKQLVQYLDGISVCKIPLDNYKQLKMGAKFLRVLGGVITLGLPLLSHDRNNPFSMLIGPIVGLSVIGISIPIDHQATSELRKAQIIFNNNICK